MNGIIVGLTYYYFKLTEVEKKVSAVDVAQNLSNSELDYYYTYQCCDLCLE
jgi:hypothetical protein